MLHAVNIKSMAHCDMSGIVAFISRRISRESAEKWHSGIIQKIRSLESNPEMWPEAFESEYAGFVLREMLYGRRRKVYRILFEILGDTVVVHRVRHAAQDHLTPDDF